MSSWEHISTKQQKLPELPVFKEKQQNEPRWLEGAHVCAVLSLGSALLSLGIRVVWSFLGLGFLAFKT